MSRESPPAERDTSGAPRGELTDEVFSEVTGERVPSFRDLSLGETAALSLSKGMRRGQKSPGDKSQKRPTRSLGTQEKASSLSIMIKQLPTLLDPRIGSTYLYPPPEVEGLVTTNKGETFGFAHYLVTTTL